MFNTVILYVTYKNQLYFRRKDCCKIYFPSFCVNFIIFTYLLTVSFNHCDMFSL